MMATSPVAWIAGDLCRATSPRVCTMWTEGASDELLEDLWYFNSPRSARKQIRAPFATPYNSMEASKATSQALGERSGPMPKSRMNWTTNDSSLSRKTLSASSQYPHSSYLRREEDGERTSLHPGEGPARKPADDYACEYTEGDNVGDQVVCPSGCRHAGPLDGVH